MHHFKSIGEFKLELQSRNAQLGSNSAFFLPCDLEIVRMNLKNNRSPLLCYIRFCASFPCRRWIQTWVTVRKRSIAFFFVPCDFEVRRMTLKHKRAHLRCCFKHSFGQNHDFVVPRDLQIWWITMKNRARLQCYIEHRSSFQSHRWIQTWARVRKLSI